MNVLRITSQHMVRGKKKREIYWIDTMPGRCKLAGSDYNRGTISNDESLMIASISMPISLQ